MLASPSNTKRLAVGEMEDDQVGDDTKAQAEAFFDYTPTFPQSKAKPSNAGQGSTGGGVSAHQGTGNEAPSAATASSGGDEMAVKKQNRATTAGASGAAAGLNGNGAVELGGGDEGVVGGGIAEAWMYGNGSE